MVRTAIECLTGLARWWRPVVGAAVVACGWVAPAQAYTVFACEPEWAALVRVLLPTATVHVATHLGQDPHHIEARPALIAQLRSADLAVCTGAELEAGWLPTLQQRAANPKVQKVFFAADHVSLSDARPGAVATPWSGDVHAQGNPHVHADPQRLLQLSEALSQRLQAELPGERQAIAQRQAAFAQAWQQRMGVWAQRAAPLRGRTVVAQHTAFLYLWQWLGLKQVADLEPQPGMAPTPGHLQRLREGLRGQAPLAIVLLSYQDARAGQWLSKQLEGRVPLLVLPATVGGEVAAEGLTRWMDGVIDALLKGATP
jgi:zinc/manganese transport system substrate-binding protein